MEDETHKALVAVVDALIKAGYIDKGLALFVVFSDRGCGKQLTSWVMP